MWWNWRDPLRCWSLPHGWSSWVAGACHSRLCSYHPKRQVQSLKEETVCQYLTWCLLQLWPEAEMLIAFMLMSCFLSHFVPLTLLEGVPEDLLSHILIAVGVLECSIEFVDINSRTIPPELPRTKQFSSATTPFVQCRKLQQFLNVIPSSCGNITPLIF